MREFVQITCAVRLGKRRFLAFAPTIGTRMSLADLPQRLAGDHRSGECDIEAAAAALHRNDKPRVDGIVDGLRHPGRLAAEQQDVVVAESEVV
jgi:hypothetical protein